MPDLCLADAHRVLSSVEDQLVRNGLAAAVAVVDAHGELILFARTDGCPLASINNAVNKAYTAARERKPSAEVGDAARTEQFAITNFGDLRYTGWGGGMPISIGGVVVGAIGVSGLPEQDDIELATGAAALLS